MYVLYYITIYIIILLYNPYIPHIFYSSFFYFYIKSNVIYVCIMFIIISRDFGLSPSILAFL